MAVAIKQRIKNELGHQYNRCMNSLLRRWASLKAILVRLVRSYDRIRNKYGFTAIQTGRTLLLEDIFPETEKGYTLHTPSLSR